MFHKICPSSSRQNVGSHSWMPRIWEVNDGMMWEFGEYCTPIIGLIMMITIIRYLYSWYLENHVKNSKKTLWSCLVMLGFHFSVLWSWGFSKNSAWSLYYLGILFYKFITKLGEQKFIGRCGSLTIKSIGWRLVIGWHISVLA